MEYTIQTIDLNKIEISKQKKATRASLWTMNETSYHSGEVVADGTGAVLAGGTVVGNDRKVVWFRPERSGEDQEYFHSVKVEQGIQGVLLVVV